MNVVLVNRRYKISCSQSCHCHPWLGVPGCKIDCVLWVGGAYTLSPVNHCDTSQTWTSVNLYVEEDTFLWVFSMSISLKRGEGGAVAQCLKSCSDGSHASVHVHTKHQNGGEKMSSQKMSLSSWHCCCCQACWYLSISEVLGFLHPVVPRLYTESCKNIQFCKRIRLS